jgi:hypothetical protein
MSPDKFIAQHSPDLDGLRLRPGPVRKRGDKLGPYEILAPIAREAWENRPLRGFMRNGRIFEEASDRFRYRQRSVVG